MKNPSPHRDSGKGKRFKKMEDSESKIWTHGLGTSWGIITLFRTTKPSCHKCVF